MTGFPPKVVRVINARATYEHDITPTCEIWVACEGARAVHRHHRLPRRAGGTRRLEVNRAANALAACARCHEHVERNRTEAVANGWILPSGQLPASVPVLYRSGLLQYLTDDGGLLEMAA